MTGHIEHSLKLAKLMTEFCGGNDDLDHVERMLVDLKLRPKGADIKPGFLLAADSGRSIKLPHEKKVSYKKEKK